MTSIVDALPDMLMQIGTTEDRPILVDAATLLLYGECIRERSPCIRRKYCTVCHVRFQNGDGGPDKPRIEATLRYLRQLHLCITEKLTLPIFDLREIDRIAETLLHEWDGKENT